MVFPNNPMTKHNFPRVFLWFSHELPGKISSKEGPTSLRSGDHHPLALLRLRGIPHHDGDLLDRQVGVVVFFADLEDLDMDFLGCSLIFMDFSGF